MATAPGERDAIRAGFGFGPDDIVAGAVANYLPVKGLDRLIRVVAGLHAELPALRLVLIGDGPLRGALEAQAADLGISANVRVHGPEQRVDVHDDQVRRERDDVPPLMT